MGPHALLLNRSHYSVLLDNVSAESKAKAALIGATPPNMGRCYVVICGEEAVEELMDLGRGVVLIPSPKYQGNSSVKRGAFQQACF